MVVSSSGPRFNVDLTAGIGIERRAQPPDFDMREIAMNSIHRIGVTIAGFATVATVAGAFGVRSYVAGRDAAAQATAQVAVAAASTTDPTASLVPQTIYVNPLPTPPVIHVVQTAPPGGRPRIIHVVVPGAGGEHDGGSDH